MTSTTVERVRRVRLGTVQAGTMYDPTTRVSYFVSYDALVAIDAPGEVLAVSSERYSKTTSKHMNALGLPLKGKCSPVELYEIARRLDPDGRVIRGFDESGRGVGVVQVYDGFGK